MTARRAVAAVVTSIAKPMVIATAWMLTIVTCGRLSNIKERSFGLSAGSMQSPSLPIL